MTSNRASAAPMTKSKVPAMVMATAWARSLTPGQQQRIQREIVPRVVEKGAFICRGHDSADHWFGIADGLGKMTLTTRDGRETTLSGIAPGGWFGEGPLLRNERRTYDVIALRTCEIACMPRATFMWLLDTNTEFRRFLLMQLSERMGLFISIVACDRLLDPTARVAHCLAALFNPRLSPGISPILKISQEEVSQLAGLSRQRANRALKELERDGLLCVEYGGITILEVRRLGEL